MRKFEYMVVTVPSKGFLGYKVDHEALTSRLNELGSKGWEVATMAATSLDHSTSHGVIILKRETSH